MNSFRVRFGIVGVAAVLAVSPPSLVAATNKTAQAQAQKPAPSAAADSVLAKAPVPDIPQSVFVVPTTPKEGRNPFFPNSSLTGIQVPKPKESSIDPSAFVLNGLTGPPRRTCMINGRTFEPGEEGEVRLQTGAKVMIKVAEIRDDSALIEVGGQRKELKLRLGA